MEDVRPDTSSAAAQASLNKLVKLAGLPESATDNVEITGSGPIFPTRYNIVPPAAAVLAATGVAAADLWAKRPSGKLLPNARVVTVSQVVQTQVGVNRLMSGTSWFVLGILVVVGGASLASAIAANVRERRREIGGVSEVLVGRHEAGQGRERAAGRPGIVHCRGAEATDLGVERDHRVEGWIHNRDSFEMGVEQFPR